MFALAARAAFSNPFSADREEIDRQLAQAPAGATALERLDLAIANVRRRFAELIAADQADIRRYRGADRRVLEDAALFDVYHHFAPAFDELIQKQIRVGDTPCAAPFAREALARLTGHGFSLDESVRFFSMFYQLRRAFYFIVHGLTGECPCMRELRLRLWNNVFTSNIRLYADFLWDRMEDFSTLLLGETGTGKGAAAAAVGRSGHIPFNERTHRFAESFTRSFIALNLSQFPATLIESELFGHEKGAFTGAIQAYAGVFQRCSPHGAIFLDEIGDLSIPVQIKLLQVLQERVFAPVGSHAKLRFSGRVIAATNRPLDELRHRGEFRDDFYYRLCSDVITVPPLRQRLAENPAELNLLVQRLVERLAGAHAPELVQIVVAALEKSPGPAYAWPGNVRELEQAVRRVLLKREYIGDLRPAAPDLRSELGAGLDAGSLTADELLAGYCRLLHTRLGTYEAVARRTGLDRRTVKKYVQAEPGTG